MDITRIDHVGLVVDDLEKWRALLVDGFGLVERASQERDDIHLAFFRLGDFEIEIIEPVDPEVRARRLGDGVPARIEHIALEADGSTGDVLAGMLHLGISPSGDPVSRGGRTMIWSDPATSLGAVFQFLVPHRS